MAIFTDVFEDVTKFGKKIPTSEYLESGKYPIIDQGQSDIAGYTNEENGLFTDVPVVIFGDHTRAVKYVDTPFFLGADGVKVLKSKIDNVNYKYLYYAVSSVNIPDTGYNRHFKWLKESDIPLPPIEKQLEIVKTLDNLTNLIDLHNQQIKKLDELVKSRFVELFGDCKNRVRLGDCCDVHARIGWQALTKNEHMKTGEYMLVTGTDFKDGEINYSTCVYVAQQRYEMDKHIILKNDDVLITKDGTIGKVAVVHNLPKPATLNAGVFVVRPDDRFNKTFIANVFRGTLFSDFVEDSKTGATIKHLNQKHLVEFMIPVPSKSEQEQFADFVKQIDKSKIEVQKSLEKLETLKKSLIQQYFG